jgi:hypothetical protein
MRRSRRMSGNEEAVEEEEAVDEVEDDSVERNLLSLDVLLKCHAHFSFVLTSHGRFHLELHDSLSPIICF